MKKSLLKSISAMLALVMLLSLAACGGPKDAAKGDGEPVEIVLWHPTSFVYGDGVSKPEDTFAGKAIAQYEKDHNVKVTIVSHPQDNFDNLFKAANIAKNGPDAVWLWTGSMTTDYAPFLVPLNDHLTQDDMDGHFGWELASEGFTMGSSIYGIPFTAYTYVMYYNKALFRQAGLSDTDMPETWEEYLAVCETLKQAGITPFVCGAKDGYIGQWGVSALMSTMIGADTSLVTSGAPLSGTAFEEAAALWAQMGEKGYVNKNALSFEANGGAITEFVNGNGAMYLNSDWVVEPIYEALGEDAGFFPFPAADAGSPSKDYNYAGAGCNICAVNYSDHVDETVEFIKFLTSAEFELGYVNEGGYLPNSTTIDSADLTLSDVKKDMYGLLKGGENSIQVDLLPLNAFNTVVRNGSLLTMGKMSAAEFTQLVDEELAKK